MLITILLALVIVGLLLYLVYGRDTGLRKYENKMRRGIRRMVGKVAEGERIHTSAVDPSGVQGVGIGIGETGEFGGTGTSYNDWVTTQAVDPRVIKNHEEFVKDAANAVGANVTGRTFSVDTDVGYDAVPWRGLRRPEAVPVSNPTQIPDINYSAYSNKPTFNWTSSSQ